MHFLSTLSIVIASMMSIPAVYSAPLAANNSKLDDGVILNYLLTLKHLESAFYTQGVGNLFDGPGNFTEESFSESQNATFLTLRKIAQTVPGYASHLRSLITTLDKTPVEPCTYNFPVTTPEEFVHVSGRLGGVVVATILGTVDRIKDKVAKDATRQMLDIDVQHWSNIRALQGLDALPERLETPLDFNQSFSLASQFIVSCPSTNPQLPFKAFPTLSLTVDCFYAGCVVKAGDKIVLEPQNQTDHQGLRVAFLTPGNPVFVNTVFVDQDPSKPGHFEVLVPEGIRGQSYVVMVKGNETVSDETIVAGPSIIEVVA